MSRIAIGGFGHETNSFVSHRADYAYFSDHRDRPPLVRGDAIFDWLRDGIFPITAFMDAMRGAHDLIPLAWAHGGAGGPVTSDAFERIAGDRTPGAAMRPCERYQVMRAAHGVHEGGDGEDSIAQPVEDGVAPDERRPVAMVRKIRIIRTMRNEAVRFVTKASDGDS